MYKSSRPLVWIMLCGLLVFTSACAGMMGSSGSKEEPTGPPPTKYLEFKDVQVPSALKLNSDASFVYETSDFRAGVLTLKGRMPVTEILDFFQANMPKDGWALLSSFKYQKNILMYTKQNKACLVIVAYPYGNEEAVLEVWVAPSKPGAQHTLLNTGAPWTGVQSPSTKPKAGSKPTSGPKEETLDNN